MKSIQEHLRQLLTVLALLLLAQPVHVLDENCIFFSADLEKTKSVMDR